MEIEVEDIKRTDKAAKTDVVPHTGGTEITMRAEDSEEQKDPTEDLKGVEADQEAVTQEVEQGRVLQKR